MKRPASTIARTAPTSSNVLPAGGKGAFSRPDESFAASDSIRPAARNGSRARIGMTAMSCDSSTPNAARPPAVCVRPRSCREGSTTAVEESERINPVANALEKLRPSSIAGGVSASAVTITCRPPRPRIVPRICHSFLGSSSSPTRKSIMTTPNSDTVITSEEKRPTQPSANGPTSTPASR